MATNDTTIILPAQVLDIETGDGGLNMLADDDEFIIVRLTRNKFGNFQDLETLLVFKRSHDDQPIVYGKQNPETGKFLEVTDDDKEYIRKQEWEFHMEDQVEDNE